MDYGLISEKQRGLSAKSEKLDHRLISKKHMGFFAKFSEILINELFSNGKGHRPGPRVRGPAGRAWSTLD
jgi:hypothetical protein